MQNNKSKNDMYSESDHTLLLSSGLPASLLQAIREGKLPNPLCHDFSAPDFELASELRHVMPGLNGLIPIFEQNGEAVIGYLPLSNQFVRCHYEDANSGDAAIELLATGYNQFASRLILDYEAAGLAKYFNSLVNFLHFTCGPELRELLDAEPYNDEAVDRFHAGLIQS